MKTLLFCLKKEFLLVWRNKTLMAMMLLMPLIQLLILPFAADMDVRNLRIAIIDDDHTPYAQQLIQKITATKLFKLASISTSYPEAYNELAAKGTDIILHIPSGFEKKLTQESQQLFIAVNAINGVKAGLSSNYLSAIIHDFNQEIHIQSIASHNLPTTYDIRYAHWFNPNTNFKYYMVPGILALLLTVMTGFMAALNIVGEKETGTMEQINVTPIKRWQFVLGKLIPFWLIGIILFSIGLLITRFVYHIPIQGSLPQLFTFSTIYIIAILALGLFISTLADTQQQSMFIAFFFIMILILMSGLFTNVESMPNWAKFIANIIPMTHFNTAIRAIILKGSHITDLLKELTYIIAFGTVMMTVAINNYKKTN